MVAWTSVTSDAACAVSGCYCQCEIKAALTSPAYATLFRQFNVQECVAKEQNLPH